MKRVLVRWLQTYSRSPLALRILAILAWGGLIWWASSRPAMPSLVDNPALGYLGNGAHVFVFGICAVLVYLALRCRGPRRAVIAVLLASAYGIIDEWHQSFVDGRDASVGDWISDTCGSVLFCAALVWLLDDSIPARRLMTVLLPVSLLAVAAETFCG